MGCQVLRRGWWVFAVVVVIGVLFFAIQAFALPSRKDVEASVIAFSFRTLAKGFVVVSDAEKLKTKLATKVGKMDQEGFHCWFLDLYEHIEDVAFFRDQYGLNRDLKKEQALKIIASLNKSKMFAMIEAVPDRVISDEFKRFLFKRKREVPKDCEKESLLQEMKDLVGALNRKYLGENK